MLMDVFIKGDVYIDYAFEQVKFRWDKKLEKVYCRRKGEPEEECDPTWSLYNDAIRTGKQITREEYFRDPAPALVEGVTTDRNVSIATALAQLKPCSGQDAERRAQRLKASAVAQQALDAVAAGTSTVSAAARDRLRAGLDALCMDTEWIGPMVAWLDCLLRRRGPTKAETDLNADELVTHYLQDCLPLSNFISNCPVLDASGPDVPAGLPLAMIRQDATLVLPIADPDRAGWLRAFAANLGMENLIVVEQAIEERRDATLFLEIISRSGTAPRQVLAGTLHRMALGGRWFLLRAHLDETELQGLPQGTQFVQAIALPAPGLEAPRQILHFATGVGQAAAALMPAVSRDPAPAPLEDLWSEPEPGRASLKISEILEAASAGGRVLKKGMWRSSGWPCVNVEPWDDRYFRLALQHIANQFGIPVPEITDDSEDPDPRSYAGADFVLEGVQVSAVSGRRCSFAAAREDIRDRIFDSLLRFAL